jgi:hypothetical protein
VSIVFIEVELFSVSDMKFVFLEVTPSNIIHYSLWE